MGNPEIYSTAACKFDRCLYTWQMACALHFYAHGSPMSLVGDAIGASKSSATRAVEAATKYLVSVAPAHITMPMDQ